MCHNILVIKLNDIVPSLSASKKLTNIDLFVLILIGLNVFANIITVK